MLITRLSGSPEGAKGFDEGRLERVVIGVVEELEGCDGYGHLFASGVVRFNSWRLAADLLVGFNC